MEENPGLKLTDLNNSSMQLEKKDNRVLKDSMVLPSVKKSRHMAFGKSVKSAKDELEFATNWRRAFNSIFTHLKWLNAFALINHLAA